MMDSNAQYLYYNYAAAAAVLSVCVTALLLLLQTMRGSSNKYKYGWPPGPPGIPVIGNLHVLLKTALPHRWLHSLAREHGDVMSLKLGSVRAVVLSSGRAAKLVATTHDRHVSNRPETAVGRNLFYGNRSMGFAPYGDQWRRNRRICALELLSPRKVEALRGEREDEVAWVVGHLWESSAAGSAAVDVSEACHVMSAQVLWRSLVGTRLSQEHAPRSIIELFDECSAAMVTVSIGDFLRWLRPFDVDGTCRYFRSLFRRYDSFADSLIRRRQPQQRDHSFLSRLLHMHEHDPSITRDNVKYLFMDMFFAGTDTSGATMEWTASLLLNHPKAMERLQQELDEVVGTDKEVKECHLPQLKYLQRVVRESMRLYPVAWLGLPHETTEDITIDGYVIPKETRLLFNLWSIGRDEKVWQNAEEFNPDRFAGDDEKMMDFTGVADEYRSVPFGVGRRSCPGSSLAIPIVMLGIASLFHTYDWRLDGALDMHEKLGNVLIRKNHIWATPKRRRNISSPSPLAANYKTLNE